VVGAYASPALGDSVLCDRVGCRYGGIAVYLHLGGYKYTRVWFHEGRVD
jgi:hypothetical protein